MTALAWRTHERVLSLVPQAWGPGIDNGTTVWGTPEVRFPCPVHGKDKPDSDGLRFCVKRTDAAWPHWWCPKCMPTDGSGLVHVAFLAALTDAGLPVEATLPTEEGNPAADRLPQPGSARLQPGKRARRRTVEPLPAEDDLARWARVLDGSDMQRWLVEVRRWSPEWIGRLQIGWSFRWSSFAVPVRDGDGDLANVRLWNPKEPKGRRWRNWPGHGHGAPLWPLPVLEAARPGSRVLLCAGEPDTVVALSLGYIAVTTPRGEGTPLRPADVAALAGMHVLVVYDSDDTGRRGAADAVQKLGGVAVSARAVDLWPDRDDGADLSDWIRTGHDLGRWAA